MAAHSNDGRGDAVGNLQRVAAANWTLPQNRKVSRGSVPQVARTHAYFTKVGGYASMNEHQVALAESTCVAVFEGNSFTASLNIVDLSALGLERATSARGAVQTMGELAEKFGYYDAGESLFVIDPAEAYIFHVLPDDTGRSAVWVAMRVPGDHVGVVANSFTVRLVDFDDAANFLHSANMRDVARRSGRWEHGQPFDFTRAFAGPEPGRKYASGRRMWAAFRRLAPVAAEGLSPTYEEYVSSAPYPPTLPACGVNLTGLMEAMRDYYQGTEFDMRRGMAAGAFGTPDRVLPGAAEKRVGGAWERTIATARTIVSYVAVARSWLPDAIGGVLWFSMHAAHTSLYSPFAVGLTMAEALEVRLPRGFTENSLQRVDRGVGAWQASRFVFNAAQLRFDLAVRDIRDQQRFWEGRGQKLVADMEREFAQGQINVSTIASRCGAHASAAVAAWWELSDQLVLRYGDSSHAGYPEWWLQAPAVDFGGGPPPSPPVPGSRRGEEQRRLLQV